MDALSAWVGATISKGSPGAPLAWLLEAAKAGSLISDYRDLSDVRLTLSGWQRREELKRGQAIGRRVLMAMKFRTRRLPDIELDQVVQAFKPAVGQCGFELFTLESGAAGLIDDQLRVALRTSRFVIADLTYGSRGAYWEAGFAEGLGRPVIYTCREKEWNDANGEAPHFDTNHLRTIVWRRDKLDEAATNLKATIRATLPAEAIMTD
jgi:nucleoside 2-deoxyribosyltransferase